MKTKGLCSTCDNNEHCVLTKQNGVLECEEFLADNKLSRSKVFNAVNRACVGVGEASEPEE